MRITRDILLKYSWIQVLIVTPSHENFMKHWLLKVYSVFFTLAQLRDLTLIWSANWFYMLLVTKVGTSSGNFLSGQDFLVLVDDVEDMVMAVQWYNSVLIGSSTDHIKILDAKIRGLTYENPIEFGQDLAPEEDLLKNSTIGCFPDLNLEPWESCHFNPEFPVLSRLKHIVRRHGSVLFSLSTIKV